MFCICLDYTVIESLLKELPFKFGVAEALTQQIDLYKQYRISVFDFDIDKASLKMAQ